MNPPVAAPVAPAAPAAPSAPSAAGSTTAGRGQRERILDITLQLMAEKGASATSMRALAAACGLNVAALYHYFPSKDALLRAVIEERRYDSQLEAMPVPDLRLPPRERLAELMLAMWDGALAEAPIWKLLLSEAIHGDTTAQEVGVGLRDTLEAALAEALPRLVPELTTAPDVAAKAASATLLALLVESNLQPPASMADHARQRAEGLAALLLPDT